MCVILLALNRHNKYPFVLAANRDEYYARETAGADYWRDHPATLAGRDLAAGGTWLGISKNGKFCAVTNHYSSNTRNPNLRSRGELTAGFLNGEHSADGYSDLLRSSANHYNGYGILFGNFSAIRYQSNMADIPTDITDGIHGLSNHFLNSPWSRVKTGLNTLKELTTRFDRRLSESLFDL